MGKSLTEIALQLNDANKKVQLIYAFNGSGKTRLSREFKQLIAPKTDSEESAEQTESDRTKILYYSSFTEDLFYWDNDLDLDADPKLKIQPNSFTKWVLQEQVSSSARISVQINQNTQTKSTQANRYDVTVLANGLPLVQIELKKRGVAIREAFNQVHRYSKESFNTDNSLFKYLQLFVISNGTDSRYFANTTKRDKNSFDFTMNWAKSDNTLIKD